MRDLWPKQWRWIGVILAVILATNATSASQAEPLTIRLVDRNGQPLPDAAVILRSTTSTGAQPKKEQAANAIMNQKDLQFMPHMLVVRQGASVSFPNEDTVSHHVYSFSRAKSFEFPQYRGEPNPPVQFDQVGVITLGCNIHDQMLGYILVVDSPWFAQTDAQGVANFASLPEGEYTIAAWSPRFSGVEPREFSEVSLPGTADHGEILIQVTDELKPPFDTDSNSLMWDDYQ